MWLLIPVLLVLHVIVCLLLVGAVLMQLPRSEGLGAAFGGGVTENLFGAQTTHVLTKLTVWLGMAFFVLTLLLAMLYAHNQPTGRTFEKEVLGVPAEAAASSSGEGAGALSAPAASPAPAEPPVPTEAPSSGEPTSEKAAPEAALEPSVSATPVPQSN